MSKHLYLFVYEQDDLNAEADWFFKVLDKDYVSTSEEEQYIADHLIEMEYAETKAEAIDMLANFWSQKVDMIDNYTIKLERSTANVKD